MKRYFFTLLILFNLYADGSLVVTDQKQQFSDIMPFSQIYIDKTNNLGISDILENKVIFKNNYKKLIGYGYSPNFTVWVKFTIKNNSAKQIDKIIEYDNAMTTNLVFYDTGNIADFKQDGLLDINSERKTINPVFKVRLEPFEERTFYIKASSYIMTLIVKLNLWNSDSFYKSEIEHQIILALFFGAMLILALYNLVIYFFTKDISYLFYVMYIFGIIAHHAMYVGVSFIYFLDPNTIPYTLKYSSIFVAFPIFALGLFTKSFLQVKQYPNVNKILNVLLILVPLSVIFFSITDQYNHYRNAVSMILFLYLISITIYATFKRNKQAY